MQIDLELASISYFKSIFYRSLSFLGNLRSLEKNGNPAKNPLAWPITPHIIVLVIQAEHDIRDTHNAIRVCGCSSVVERHVANVNVVSSNLITRFCVNSIGELPSAGGGLGVGRRYV